MADLTYRFREPQDHGLVAIDIMVATPRGVAVWMSNVFLVPPKEIPTWDALWHLLGETEADDRRFAEAREVLAVAWDEAVERGLVPDWRLKIP